MGLKFQITIVEHLVTGWGKKKGRKKKPKGKALDVGFLLIHHLSFTTNNRRSLLPPAPAHSGGGTWSVNQGAPETVSLLCLCREGNSCFSLL